MALLVVLVVLVLTVDDRDDDGGGDGGGNGGGDDIDDDELEEAAIAAALLGLGGDGAGGDDDNESNEPSADAIRGWEQLVHVYEELGRSPEDAMRDLENGACFATRWMRGSTLLGYDMRERLERHQGVWPAPAKEPGKERNSLPLFGPQLRAEIDRAAVKAYNKAYRAKNAKSIAARKKVYRAENAESIAAYKKAYAAKNAESIAARKKVYRAENAESIAAYNNKNAESIAARKKVYCAENAESIAARKKAYRAENAESIAAQKKVYNAKNAESHKAYCKAYRKNPVVIARKAAKKVARIAELAQAHAAMLLAKTGNTSMLTEQEADVMAEKLIKECGIPFEDCRFYIGVSGCTGTTKGWVDGVPVWEGLRFLCELASTRMSVPTPGADAVTWDTAGTAATENATTTFTTEGNNPPIRFAVPRLRSGSKAISMIVDRKYATETLGFKTVVIKDFGYKRHDALLVESCMQRRLMHIPLGRRLFRMPTPLGWTYPCTWKTKNVIYVTWSTSPEITRLLANATLVVK